MQEPSTLPPRGPRQGIAFGQMSMVLPGSKGPAKVQWGFPRNLGDPVVSVEFLYFGLGWPTQTVRARRSSVHGRRERSGERVDGTAKRRERSAAGRAAGSRSALIVPSKRGNPVTPGDRVEGSGASDHETSGRKHVGCLAIRTACQRNAGG